MKHDLKTNIYRKKSFNGKSIEANNILLFQFQFQFQLKLY